ncbi:MAG: hypothetical protein ACLQOO_15175, partial [Terriglobia bacterium]
TRTRKASHMAEAFMGISFHGETQQSSLSLFALSEVDADVSLCGHGASMCGVAQSGTRWADSQTISVTGTIKWPS